MQDYKLLVRIIVIGIMGLIWVGTTARDIWVHGTVSDKEFCIRTGILILAVIVFEVVFNLFIW